ncbi:MAG TPA: FtsQ-type POTRA domain-containing protein [Thermoanaerobaculia bacterium]|nr:FtsQ-type POTRA domain-containing protein [Thermoanaerobaculia bacterium]
MSGGESTGRFMRPIDVRAVPRSRRRVQARRLLLFLANLALVLALGIGGVWVFQRTRQDERFAIRSIETVGAQHASRSSIDEVLVPYRGANLFRLDIHRLQQDLASVAWVERAAIQKQLPGSLRVEIFERKPLAIVEGSGDSRYIDAAGVIFAGVSPRIDNLTLPRIIDATDVQAKDAVKFLAAMQESSPALFSRIVTLAPADGWGWEIADRTLGTRVLIDGATSAKWPLLDQVIAAERFTEGAIDYADLRFSRQIVVMPRERVNGGELKHAQN